MDIYYIGERFVEEKEALISVNDLSVLRGYGVFDFLRTYNNSPFHLEEHLDRLERSARLIGLSLPFAKSDIAELVVEGIKLSGHKEKKIRIVVTGGLSPDGITPGEGSQLLLMITAVTPLPPEWLTEGAKVITSHVDRFMPGSKSINYIPAILCQKDAAAQQAIEAIYVDKDGYLLEGTTSNLFGFIDNTLITPQAERILPGITRKVVLELAQENFSIVEREVHRDEIRLLDEAFITSSVREIVPVTAMDSVILGLKPGPNTIKILESFSRYTSTYSG